MKTVNPCYLPFGVDIVPVKFLEYAQRQYDNQEAIKKLGYATGYDKGTIAQLQHIFYNEAIMQPLDNQSYIDRRVIQCLTDKTNMHNILIIGCDKASEIDHYVQVLGKLDRDKLIISELPIPQTSRTYRSCTQGHIYERKETEPNVILNICKCGKVLK